MPDTPLYLQAHFREQVKDTFEEGIQQTVSKFQEAGIVDTDWTADQLVFRTRGTLNFVETTGLRGGKTQQGEFQAGFRSGFRRDFEAAIQFDRNDSRKLFTANLPDSEVQVDMQYAWHRAMDDVFIDAAQAQALGGPKPYITPQALPSTMTIAVGFQKLPGSSGANTNFTLWKIEEALTRMAVQEVDLDREMVVIAITPAVKQAWLHYAQSATNDVFAKMVTEWRMDPSKGLLGCKVVVTNRLKTSSGNVQCLVFCKRGFKLSPSSYEIKIDELPSDRHQLQIAAYAHTGCVRARDEMVNLVWADPTATLLN